MLPDVASAWCSRCVRENGHWSGAQNYRAVGVSFSDGELLRQFAADRALAASVIFAHRHPNSSPPAHVEIMDLWACPEELVLIEAAREFGKSTLSEEFLLLEACFGNFNYCLLIGETYSKACQRLASIDYEARNNETLHGLFGGPVLARKRDRKSTRLNSSHQKISYAVFC